VADCGIVGVVSGGITVLCGNIHTTAHGKGDGLCLVVLTFGQGEIAGRPTVKHIALRDQVLVQLHGHFCAFRYVVGLFAGGCVSSNSQGIGHIAAVVFHSNSAAGHGQRVAAQSIGVELPTGIEGGVLRNCGFVHIKGLDIGLVIFGVPAGELVTRTGGIMDGSIDGIPIVCLGLSDFFGLINRHLSVVVQFAAIGIKGHLAEVKKIAFLQYIIAFKLFCVVLVAVVVDGTIGNVSVDNTVALFIKKELALTVLLVDRINLSSHTSAQIILEGGQSGREHNAFQT